MDLSSKFIARFLQSEQTVPFVCDRFFQIQLVGKDSPLAAGAPLSSLFGGESDVYFRTIRNLECGIVFFSTKFELFHPFSSIILIPILENHQLDSVLGILDAKVQQENDRPVSLMTQISDRYRTPVSNILNMLSALSTALRDESYDRERAYLNAAARECYAILRGVVPSHDYYLLVNRKMPYEPTTLLLGDFLEDLYITLRPFFRKRGQRLVLSKCQTPLPVSIDPRLFSLALFHLISNAANFSPLDSTITISLLESSRYCTVTVSDEGDGIAAEDLPRVFEPFYVCPDTRLPESQLGSGLGLPIVQEIVKLHGGDIFLTSEQNHGTSAAIRLPFSENPSANLVHADTSKYVTDKFSDLYILFAELCEINLFYPS